MLKWSMLVQQIMTSSWCFSFLQVCTTMILHCKIFDDVAKCGTSCKRVFFWLLSGIEYFKKGHRFSSSLKLFWSTIFSGFCSKRTSPQQQLDAWIHLPNTKETGHVYAHVRKHSREESWKKSRLPTAADFCRR